MSSNSFVYNPNAARFDMPLGMFTTERRYDPIVYANDWGFKQDTAYFKARKDRYQTIRKAWPGEFDNLEAQLWLEGRYISPPIAWIRVLRLPTVGLRSGVVYRGSLAGEECDAQGYLLNCNSDATVDLYVDKMQKQGCANWPEVNLYIEQLEQAKALYNAQHTAIDSRKVQ